jgi:hypothetical protein
MNFFELIDKGVSYFNGLNFYIKFLLIYILGHFGFLYLLDSYWWDDWCWVNASPETIVNEFSEYGVPLFGYFQVVNFSVSPIISRLFTLSAFFTTAILLYKISLNYTWLNDNNRNQIVVLFSVLPLNIARISLVNTQYTACLLLFFIAWYLIRKNLLVSAMLFALSFLTQSLIAFFILPIVDMLLSRKFKKQQILMFSFLPILMFLIKQVYFKPYGQYLGTHKINLSIKKVLKIYYYSFEDFLCYLDENRILLIVFTFIFVLIILFGHFNKNEVIIKPQKRFILLIMGTLALFLAILPYAVGQYVPRFYGWDSRHQILMPLGVSLILVWSLNILQVKGLYILIVFFSCIMNNKNYSELKLDWNQQKMILHKLSKIHLSNGQTLFLFNNKLNWAINRDLRFYEYTGWIKQSLNNNSCFALENVLLDDFENGLFDGFYKDAYNAKNFVRDDKNKVINVDLTYLNKDKGSINVKFTRIK